MIVHDVAPLEKRKVAAVARQLSAQGYRVVVHPQDGELPAFLQGFRPAAVATRGAGGVVVDVKTRQTLQGAADLPGLAEILRRQAGWRLERFVTNPRERPIAGRGDRLDRAELRSRIGEAKEVLADGSHTAAMLLAWSAAEGALRLLAERANIRLEKDDPSFVVRKLTMHGVLGDTEYGIPRPAVDVRNAPVHGYSAADLDPALVEQLVTVADRLVAAG
jgi:hypothetical protein